MNVYTRFRYYFLFFVYVCTTFGCVRDVDFDQAEDIVLRPVFEIDFIYSEFDTDDFVSADLPPNIPINPPPIVDIAKFDVLGNEFATENLEQVDLTFEIRNSFAIPITFSFQFLGGGSEPIGTTYSITVAPGNGEGAPSVLTNAVFSLDKETLNTLSNSEQIRSEIRILNANSSTRGRISLKSAATYFILYPI